MKRELRDRWIAALESGDYKKGRDMLCRSDAFCCLGVLADVCDDLSSDPDSLGRRHLLSTPEDAITVPVGYHGLTQAHIRTLWTKNDSSDTFGPVVGKIRELFPDEVCS